MAEENNVEIMTTYDVAIHVLQDLHQRYFDATDEQEKAKICNQILATLDRISKMDETIVAQNKNELDNQTKLEMNKLDNETKLKICQLETSSKKEIETMHKMVEEGKMAIQGTSSILETGAKTLSVLGGIMLTGAAMNMECDGYTAGKSLAYKLATDLGRKIRT